MVNSMRENAVDCKNVWFVDLGASNHMTSHGEWFNDVKNLEKLVMLKQVMILLIQLHRLVRCHWLCRMEGQSTY